MLRLVKLPTRFGRKVTEQQRDDLEVKSFDVLRCVVLSVSREGILSTKDNHFLALLRYITLCFLENISKNGREVLIKQELKAVTVYLLFNVGYSLYPK